MAGVTGLEPAASCVTGRRSAAIIFCNMFIFNSLHPFMWGGKNGLIKHESSLDFIAKCPTGVSHIMCELLHLRQLLHREVNCQ